MDEDMKERWMGGKVMCGGDENVLEVLGLVRGKGEEVKGFVGENGVGRKID